MNKERLETLVNCIKILKELQTKDMTETEHLLVQRLIQKYQKELGMDTVH